MAHIHANRVRDTTTSTGTGALALSGSAPAGYQTFSARMSTGDTCMYVIHHRTQNEWEVGWGTYSATDELTRTHVRASSNSDAAVSLSPGTKDVAIVNIAQNEFQKIIEYTDDRTLGMVDAFQFIEMNKVTAVVVTVPVPANVAFPIGTRIDFIQTGAGQVSFVEQDTTMNINSKDGNLKLAGQFSVASLIYKGNGEWHLFGDLTS